MDQRLKQRQRLIIIVIMVVAEVVNIVGPYALETKKGQVNRCL
jgi:hypothetical protein